MNELEVTVTDSTDRDGLLVRVGPPLTERTAAALRGVGPMVRVSD